jgi:alginate O-acetyltransferase complex protein AlgI
MLFTSLHWLVFLVTSFTMYHALPTAARRWFMLAASVYFYASWSVVYLALIAGQIVVDWTCGYLLGRTEDPRWRKAWMVTSVTVNLGTLCLFKYYDFIAQSFAAGGAPLPGLHLALPLAISFYTFESMSYTIDVYRRRLAPVRSPLHLALFITWFPHLIAGPIIRPANMFPQLRATREGLTREQFFSGASLMLLGYTKKLLGADWLAGLVDTVFTDPTAYSTPELLVAVYAYAFQIYLDFSAYTDIARGASRWFGIELPENFNAPYLATSVTDFWRRWHMTLSQWLRDYLYIPLGGNRLGRTRTYVNIMITMLLGGLWHGAAWTFVAWGGLHGLYLAVERALGVQPEDGSRGITKVLRQFLTFHLVCVAWVFFRARTFTVASQIFSGIIDGPFTVSAPMMLSIVGTLVIIAAYWVTRSLRPRVLSSVPGPSLRPQIMYGAAAGVVVLALIAFGASTTAFIYFRF